MHKLLGHHDKETTKIHETHWLENQLWVHEPCESCVSTKVKKKDITKSCWSEKAKVNFGIIYSDISMIKPKHGEETILRNNWFTMVDKKTGYKVSNFYVTKVVWWSQVVLNLKSVDKPTSSGEWFDKIMLKENKKLPAQSNEAASKLHMHFEYTANDTP